MAAINLATLGVTARNWTRINIPRNANQKSTRQILQKIIWSLTVRV